jgi:ferric-dicitrate binding protein FerR (iron transport regulator)
MQFTVEYNAGVWIFTVTSDDDEPDYLEEFEITNQADAAATAYELIEELKEAAEAGDEEDEDADPLEGFLDELEE